MTNVDTFSDAAVARTLNMVIGVSQDQAPLSARLLHAMRAHIDAEAQSLEACRQVREDTKDPVVRMVLDAYLEEEQRHHDLFVRLAEQIENEIDPGQGKRSLPAGGDYVKDPAIAQRLHALRDAEKRGIRKLRQLAKETKNEYGGALSILLETVAYDSAKHEHMLAFAERKAA